MERRSLARVDECVMEGVAETEGWWKPQCMNLDPNLAPSTINNHVIVVFIHFSPCIRIIMSTTNTCNSPTGFD